MRRSLYPLLLTAIIPTMLFSSPSNNKLFENKNILVIGGTGYLGKAIVSNVLAYNPRKVIIFSRDEVKHFHCFKQFGNNSKLHYVIGDIRDYKTLLQVTKGVDIVFHAGALKRIDSVENNVQEAIKTNIIGSMNVFNACCKNRVDKVLFISTDKACSPINAYGATKFISEKIFTNYDKSIPTKFIVGRFGNIFESTGSVIPIFVEKIKKGDAIPLTDEKMTRFTITKQEAVELLFDALRYAHGGEIFVRQLPAFKVVDLIDALKKIFNSDNKVDYIGPRPGEKIHEVLINESEMKRTFQFKDYYIITPTLVAKNTQNAAYIKRGISVEHNPITEYCSNQAVIPQKLLCDLIEKCCYL